jgi:hypothetical protein
MDTTYKELLSPVQFTLHCPVPNCPEPDCPVPDCPVLDLAAWLCQAGHLPDGQGGTWIPGRRVQPDRWGCGCAQIIRLEQEGERGLGQEGVSR